MMRLSNARLAALVLLVLGPACTGELGLNSADNPPLPDGGGSVQEDAGTISQPDGGTTILPDGGTVGGECQTPLAVFERETWPQAGKAVCAGCHLAGGVAEDQGSNFLLKDETSLTSEGLSLQEFYEYNLDQFRTFATPTGGDTPTFIAKALGELEHGGGAVVTSTTAPYQALEALITSFETEGDEACVEPPHIDPIADLSLLPPDATLRKATMMLAGRLPTEAELAELDGLPEDAALARVEALLEPAMDGAEFHEWLKYAWNEIFMFRGLWELDVTFDFFVLSPQDFRARTWGFLNRGNFGCETMWDGQTTWERFAYPSLAVCENNPFARNYLSRRVAWSLMEGPLELIAWIVENGRPFTDILTTDTVMMNYYSSVAYFGSAQPADNPWVARHLSGLPLDSIAHPAGSTIESIDLPFLHEFHPMTSVSRNRIVGNGAGNPVDWEYRDPAEYPRAGLLTDQLFLTRYPTTDTNVNRHRTWAFFQHFLGIDILSLADRRGDPAAAELNSDQPTIDDPNCNVCHNVMDPVAGLFQDFWVDAEWNDTRAWPPVDQPNMIGPGISIIGPNAGADYDPEATQMAPLQWLGSETAKDPRFASRMVRHAFLQLTGHEPMEAPGDPTAVGWRGRVRAYEVQSAFLNELREDFVAANFDVKRLYRKIIVSPWYRATALASAEVSTDPDRLAATESFGDGDQLLTPFELHRKIEAVLEGPWRHRAWVMRGANLNVIDENAPENDFLLRFNSDNDFRYIDAVFRDMYGGIDFLNNTARLVRPSSVMAAAGRRASNELACATVAYEFAWEPRMRALFADVEPGMPSTAPAVRATIVDLHRRMLGQMEPTAEDVDATLALYEQVLADGTVALADGQAKTALPPHCAATGVTARDFTAITEDPTYGIRAWMAVVSYLALDPAFLYSW